MPRPLKFGRAKQYPADKQAGERSTDFTSQMFTGAVMPEAAESSENPRSIGSGGPHALPSSPLSRGGPQEVPELLGTIVPSSAFSWALAPEAIQLPSVLTIGGYLFQRIVATNGESVTILASAQQGATNSASEPFAQDEVGHVRQDSQVPSASQALPHSSTSTGSHLNARTVQPAIRKSKRKSNMIREPEPHNQSPEPDLGPEQEQPLPETAHSPQPKQKKSQRKSVMLREIEAHNQSPEAESDVEVEMLCHLKDDWGDVPLTRSVSNNLVNFVKGEPPTPRKNLNLRALMLAEFSGIEKGTKTFYREDNTNFGSSSHQTQQGLGKNMNLRDEEEDEWEDLPKSGVQGVPNGRSHPQWTPSRGILPRQVEQSVGDSRRDQKLAAESATVRWANRKGQSAYFTFSFRALRLSDPGYLPSTLTLSNDQLITDFKMIPTTVDVSYDLLTDSEMAAEKAERIIKLVKSPGYHPRPTEYELAAQARKKPAYHEIAELPDSIHDAFHLEQGVHVFTPTAAVFLDFGRFLRDVEEIAGRKMGVVKVIVPSECLSQAPPQSASKVPRSPVIETVKINISLNANAAHKPSKIYDMLTENQSTSVGANEWLQKIQSDRANIIKKRAISTEVIGRNEVWKESHAQKPFSERRMIRRNEKHEGSMLCALNAPATPTLRGALNCRDPNIANLFGNRFASSPSTHPGINESVFHIAGCPGPLSRLQINKYAAYSLNYHHSGAPKLLTVTRPEHYAKLEEVTYITQNSATLSGRAHEARTCSQFVEHQPMYMPRKTMSNHGIEYTEVVQQQGDMVIIFPFAYHQAYTSGPNITEELLYASDRCKVFHRENLYQHCNRKCAAGQPNSDLKAFFSDNLNRSRSGRSGREFPSNLRLPRQSREASTPQIGEAARRPRIHTQGLGGMMILTDDENDGDWNPASAEESRVQPCTPRKSTRLTSNPFTTDEWDPDHAFEAPYGAANNDEGSPIGGSRPRDIITGRYLEGDEWREISRASRRKRVDDSDDSQAPLKHRRRRHH